MLGWTQGKRMQQERRYRLYQEPVSVPALNALGIVYLVSGELTAAVVVHTWAAILEPGMKLPYNESGFSSFAGVCGGVATAKKAAALEPANPHPMVALAIAHWDMRSRTLHLPIVRHSI